MGGAGDDIYGQVEYKVLSLAQLEAQQRDAVNYVQDMLQLKVRRPSRSSRWLRQVALVESERSCREPRLAADG